MNTYLHYLDINRITQLLIPWIATIIIGIILDCELRDKSQNLKCIDLLDISSSTNAQSLADKIVASEPLIPSSLKPQVLQIVEKLVDKASNDDISNDFYLFKILQAHILPVSCGIAQGPSFGEYL